MEENNLIIEIRERKYFNDTCPVQHGTMAMPVQRTMYMIRTIHCHPTRTTRSHGPIRCVRSTVTGGRARSPQPTQP